MRPAWSRMRRGWSGMLRGCCLLRWCGGMRPHVRLRRPGIGGLACGLCLRPGSRWFGNPHRRGPRRPSGGPLVVSDLERQLWAVGVADVDDLAVLDVDGRYPPAVDERSIQRTIVDRHPPALVETQQQVRTRDQRMRDPHVGAQIASDDHVVTRREAALRSVISDRQHRRGWSTHCPNCSWLVHPTNLSVGARGIRIGLCGDLACRPSQAVVPACIVTGRRWIARLHLTPQRGVHRHRASGAPVTTQRVRL